MLSYKQQYDISNGLFLTWDNHLEKRLLHSNHGQKVRDKIKSAFPYYKYESRNRETFILGCLYIIFKKTPSSYRAMIAELKDLELKEISKFKHDIMYYQDFIKQDLSYLIENHGGVISSDKMLREYTSGKIKFYTLWFYYQFNPDEDIEKLRNSRVFSHIYRKLKFMMMFLTFSEDSVKDVRILFNKMEL